MMPLHYMRFGTREFLQIGRPLRLVSKFDTTDCLLVAVANHASRAWRKMEYTMPRFNWQPCEISVIGIAPQALAKSRVLSRYI